MTAARSGVPTLPAATVGGSEIGADMQESDAYVRTPRWLVEFWLSPVGRRCFHRALAEKVIGTTGMVPIRHLTRKKPHRVWDDLLTCFDRGAFHAIGAIPRSTYFHDICSSRGLRIAVRDYCRTFRLYHSIVNSGFVYDFDEIDTCVLVIFDGPRLYNISGWHRSNICRYLGYRVLPVIAISKADMLVAGERFQLPHAIADRIADPVNPPIVPVNGSGPSVLRPGMDQAVPIGDGPAGLRREAT